MNHISLAEKAIYITSRKFPASYIANYQNNKKAWVIHSHVKAEESAEIRKKVNDYMYELSQKTLEEINLLYDQEQKQEVENRRLCLQEQERLRQKKLFFNQSEAKADFDYWSKMPSWTTDEAVALLLDKDPRVVNWDNISPHATPMHKKPESFAKEYQDLRDLLIRKYGTNQYIITVPSELIEWADGVGVKVPEELQKMVLERGDQSTDWKALHEEKCKEVEELKKNLEDSQSKRKELVIRTRASTNSNKMLKIALAVIAKEKFKYDEDSSAIGTMLSYFARQGFNTDDQTLRERIKEGLILLKNKKPD